LVDDNQNMRIILNEMLRAVGVTYVFEAANGAEGFQLMHEHKFDVVITDFVMQPLNGIEFVRLIRTDPRSPDPEIPVVMITGHSTTSRVNAARDAGVDEFLTKPLTARAVIERLHMAINHPRPYVTSAGYMGPDRRRRDDPRFIGPWRRQTDADLAGAEPAIRRRGAETVATEAGKDGRALRRSSR
jgi:two-component system chemotaxis response regulator CheY